jgi:NADH-quinone oxidoreductase subunit J
MHPAGLLGVTVADGLTFGVAAAMVLLGAVGVVAMRNPVHSALSLVLTLFGVAVLFVAQGANFLAAVQVIVYAGAIVVLFLFVIMLLGVDREERLAADPLRGQRLLAVLVGAAVVSLVLVLADVHWATGAKSVAGSTVGPGSDVAKLGRSVFTTYLLPFEATSALLVLAVVGAVILVRRHRSTEGDQPAEAGQRRAEGGPSATHPGETHPGETHPGETGQADAGPGTPRPEEPVTTGQGGPR